MARAWSGSEILNRVVDSRAGEGELKLQGAAKSG